MRARLKVSRAGIELIKSFEGLRQTATRLPDGRWTLGYGHTFSAREGARVTQEDADALLRFDLLPIVDAVNNLVLVPLNQNQFDALVSFCFNIGVDNFAVSTVLKRLNEGKPAEAAQAMDAWRSAEFNGQTYVLAPLIRRRAGRATSVLIAGASELNTETHEFSRDGVTEVLSAREYALILALIERPGRILSRSQIEERIYGWGEEVESNAVDVLIHSIRRKFGKDIILNVRGAGWMAPKS